MFSLINQTQNKKLIVKRLLIADDFFSRAKGLLGRRDMAPDEGLLITRCRSIHMMFMRFSIDAVFLDRQKKVVGLVSRIKPFCFSPIFWSASSVVELPAGTIISKNIQRGDMLEIVETDQCPPAGR